MDIEFVRQIHQLQGLTHDHAGGLPAEKSIQRTIIDFDLAAAGRHVDPRGRGLAASGSIELCLIHYCCLGPGALRAQVFISSGIGCCAS
jgi:hypothetical protein